MQFRKIELARRAAMLTLFLALIPACASLSQNATTKTDVHFRAAKMVEWKEAERLLRGGEITEVFQAHSLSVFLTSKEGETVCSKEPSIDYVVDLIHQENLPVSIVIE